MPPHVSGHNTHKSLGLEGSASEHVYRAKRIHSQEYKNVTVISLTSIKAPQGHCFTKQRAAPRRSPTATRISSFSRLRQLEAMGRKC